MFEGRQVSRIPRSLMRDCCHNGEHILDAMVRLLEQTSLPLNESLALADVSQKTHKQWIAELVACGDL